MNVKRMTPFLTQFNYPVKRFQKPAIEVKKTLQPVPREESNLEAEEGEEAVVSDGSGLPAKFKIEGQPHSSGGTPLNLPDNSFIFSKDRSMRITDETILKQFGMAARKKGYTPAEISKKYDVNDFRKVLADKDSDKLQRDTAEAMIANYNEKLAKLALVQESLKGFPNGIPLIAQPYLHSSGMDMTQLLQQEPNELGDEEEPDMENARFGGQTKPKYNFFRKGGENKAPSSNKGMVTIQYAKPLTKEGYNRDEESDNYGNEEVLRKVRVIAPEKLQKGGEPKKKGIATYDPTEQAILKKLFPNVVLPEDVVEAKQKKTGVGYGRFDKAAADKNWSWYGKPIDWNNPKEVGEAQQAYNDRIYKKLIAAGHPEDAAKKMVERIGFDPNAKNQPNALDSNAGKYTETRVDIDPLPLEKAAAVVAEEGAKDKGLAKLDVVDVNGENKEAPANYWLQDIVKTAGAAGDMYRVKKYLPWQGTYNPFLPQTTFYDPTRELAQNSEMANISAQAAGMFGSPQQLSARLSAIQGQGAQNAANILGKYNNLNVSASNQNEAQRAAILNEAGMNAANQATTLYNKNVIANQQFDNSKAMARQNLRNSFLDAITNRAQTQALNSIQKQYQVDPLTGGLTKFTGGRDITPEKSEQDIILTKIEEGMRRFPGTSFKDWADLYTKGK